MQDHSEIIPKMELVLADRGVPIEIFVILLLVTGGFYIIVYIIKQAGNSASERQDTKILAFKRGIVELSACMISIDTEISDEEISTASEIGKKLFGDKFDERRLKLICDDKNRKMDWKSSAESVGALLDTEQKTLILKFLAAIAHADGEVDISEITLLLEIAEFWKIDPETIFSQAEHSP